MRILSLYCGGGGIDEGLKQAGLHTTLAIDAAPYCCETMRLNHPNTEVICSQVADLEHSLGRYDMVVGGPPCTDFSLANVQKTMDTTEVERFWRIVRNVHAKTVIMENVPNVAKVLPPGTASMNKYVVNAADYGVPQIRRRLIVTNLLRPRPTHSEHGGQSTLDGLHLHPWVTIRDALNLPPDGIIQDRKQCRDPDRPRNYTVDRPSCTIHTDSRMWLVARENRGCGNWDRRRPVDSPAYTVMANSRLWLLTDLQKKYPQRFEKHAPFQVDKPARTILGKDYCTPYQMVTDNMYARKLTVEELAVLQGFPPGYRFAGGKTKQIRQIGNALPPAVTRASLDRMCPEIEVDALGVDF